MPYATIAGMGILIVEDSVSLDELRKIAANQFGDFVKFVVDIENEIIAVGADLHADEEAVLLEKGSGQQDLWGINYYPERPVGERIEFHSMINLRPSQGNRSRGIDDPAVREKVVRVVDKLVAA